jgi:hypothetical protein
MTTLDPIPKIKKLKIPLTDLTIVSKKIAIVSPRQSAGTSVFLGVDVNPAET